MTDANRLFIATLPTGQQVLVTLFGPDHTEAEIAFRARPEPRITWGPPTRLEEVS